MLDTSIQVKTDFFDGPLALLLHLIQKEEMNIKDLNLTKITKQYLDYLAHMRELNFDLAGEYLFLASTLLLLKSKSCVTEEDLAELKGNLDGEELNITSQSELVRRLEELQHFQKMGEKLWALPKKGHEIFVKPKINRKAIVNSILTPVELEKLIDVMVDFIFRQNRKFAVVRRDRLSIKEKLVFLKENLKLDEQSLFSELLEKDGDVDSTDNIVITFISLLELARLKRIKIFQNDAHGNIYIDVVKSLQDFNVDTATGFEEEEGASPDDDELESLIQDNAEMKVNEGQARPETETLQ